jgi:prepilin-type N-terminal cleavage/methylation domain-containing protein
MISKLKKIGLPAQPGFTLIETLLAILILAMAIAGPLSIAAKGLQLALISKDQVTATYLAQDGIEYVRFIRDTNRLQGLDWLAGLDGTSNGHTFNSGGGQANCTGGNQCIIDSLKDQVTYCGTSVATCAQTHLYFDPTNNYYTYSTAGTTQTIFSRTVSVTPASINGGSNEADVIVTVQWQDIGGVTRSVVLREDMFNWQ